MSSEFTSDLEVSGVLQPPFVRLENISKRYGAVQALDRVELSVRPGEIIGLLGQNGSGKSTLVGILSGTVQPDSGSRVWIDEQEISFPLVPERHAFSFVFQHLALVPNLTVLENLVIPEFAQAGQPGRPINWRAARRRARDLFREFGVSIPLDRRVNELPVLDRAMLAIVRAVANLRRSQLDHGVDGGMLVLDEPTVFLPSKEKRFLLDLIRRSAGAGLGVVFVSHDLPSVIDVCSRVVVLRNGQLVAEASTHEATPESLSQLMLPASLRTVARDVASPEEQPRTTALPIAVDGLVGGRLRGLSLNLEPGTILGVAGLVGSGAQELPYLLFGAQRARGGRLKIGDGAHPLRDLTPPVAAALGFGLVPADRAGEGLATGLTIAENTEIRRLKRYVKHGALRRSWMRREVGKVCVEYKVKTRSPNARIVELSGGNQQKVLIAKWCDANPRLLLLHEPTQGVDVVARDEIYSLLRKAANAGAAIVWVTTDFEELVTVSDRVAVLVDGALTADLASEQISLETITRLALGSSAGLAA